MNIQSNESDSSSERKSNSPSCGNNRNAEPLPTTTTTAPTTATSSSSSQAQATPSPPQWHNFVAGGVAGAGSRIVTAPLDLIRIRRQLQATTVVYPTESMWTTWQKIVQTEQGGVRALFRGNTAAIALWISYAAVQFAVYTPCRQAWQQQTTALPETVVAFGAGAVAGVCATLATYPFDVCRTTFAAQGLQVAAPAPTLPPPPMSHHSSLAEPHYPIPTTTTTSIASRTTISTTTAPRTMGQFVVQLYQTRGISGFYAGAGPAVAQIIPYMGLNFALYDALTRPTKIRSNEEEEEEAPGLSSATAGAIAGAVSKLMIYPVDTIKRRCQAQAFFDQRITTTNSSSTAATTTDTARHRVWRTVVEIYQQGGWKSFYRGVYPSLLKTTIATSLSFSLFRFTKEALETYAM